MPNITIRAARQALDDQTITLDAEQRSLLLRNWNVFKNNHAKVQYFADKKYGQLHESIRIFVKGYDNMISLTVVAENIQHATVGDTKLYEKDLKRHRNNILTILGSIRAAYIGALEVIKPPSE